MGKTRPRPNNPRLERPRDAVSEAQIEAMRVKLRQRCNTAGASVVSGAVPKPTATAGGGTPLPLEFIEARPPSTRPAPINAEADSREKSVREALSQPLGTSAPLPNHGSSEGKSDDDQPTGPRGTFSRKAPMGVPPSTAAALQWDSPVVNPDDLTGYVKDLTGAYSIVKERLSDGTYRYLAFKGSAVLAPACASLECAKAHCEAAAAK